MDLPGGSLTADKSVQQKQGHWEGRTSVEQLGHCMVAKKALAAAPGPDQKRVIVERATMAANFPLFIARARGILVVCWPATCCCDSLEVQ